VQNLHPTAGAIKILDAALALGSTRVATSCRTGIHHNFSLSPINTEPMSTNGYKRLRIPSGASVKNTRCPYKIICTCRSNEKISIRRVPEHSLHCLIPQHDHVRENSQPPGPPWANQCAHPVYRNIRHYVEKRKPFASRGCDHFRELARIFRKTNLRSKC